MIGIKARLERTQKLVRRLEDEYRDALNTRIQRLGYRPDEVLADLPLEHAATRARLMVVLEYEELCMETQPELITEPQFACSFYPEVILNYLHYLLDEVGVPPVEEIDIYRGWILDTNPSYTEDFDRLEHKWRVCAAEAGMDG